MTRRIAIVEDEPAIADNIVYALKTEGFEPQWVNTGAAALEAIRQTPPQLIILDIGLPDISGFDLCRQIRAQWSLPIIFLSARHSEIDRVVGLEIGGDDYVVKPFSPRELVARVRARLRTQTTTAPTPEGFDHDADTRQIHLNGRLLDLTRYEYRILAILLAAPGRVYSREDLLQQAWDHPEEALDRTVDTHIKTLRQKIRDVDARRDPIRTRRGEGYAYDPGH